MKLLFVVCFCLMSSLCADLLPSWNEGSAKQRILQFVKETTDASNEAFVPVSERIVTFDQDGTLWVEQPIYTQFFFAIDRVRALAVEHPEWKENQPFKNIIEGKLESLKGLTIQEIEKIIAATHSGMTVDQFNQTVSEWLKIARHPRYEKPYTDLVYQPMLELIDLLQKNQFKVYIVSGGGQEFIRNYSERVYGLPVEQIIGTASKVRYEYHEGKPVLVKLPEVLYINDKAGKPGGINYFIGKYPVAAFGNSDGDQQMLEWSQVKFKKNLQLLVHHDDSVREYAYGPNSKVGTFSNSLMDEAKQRNWIVVSMKKDWKVIFPFEKSAP